MRNFKIIWLPIVILLLLFLFACQAWEDRQTVATVNGEVIKKKPYRLIYQARYQGLARAHAQIPAGMGPQLAKQIIDEMINDVLFFQEAKKRNLVPSREEINQSMGHTKEGGVIDPNFTKALQEKGITMEELLEEMQRRMAIAALQKELTRGIETTEQEAREYYQKNKQLFYIPAQYQIRLLYAQDPAQAEAYLNQINSGKSRFEDLVQKNPPRFAQVTGTQSLWVTAEDFSPEMGKVLKETKGGKVGGPVKGMEGFFLIKVYAKKARRLQGFKEAKDRILGELNQKKREMTLTNWLTEQKKKATIEIKESRLAVKVEPKAPAKAMMPSGPSPSKAGGDKG